MARTRSKRGSVLADMSVVDILIGKFNFELVCDPCKRTLYKHDTNDSVKNRSKSSPANFVKSTVRLFFLTHKSTLWDFQTQSCVQILRTSDEIRTKQ